MAGHTFISYSKKDAGFAFKLADDLEKQGFSVWIDREIGGGERWRSSIIKALREANEVVVVLTPDARESEWVMHEGSVASGLEKPIYPLLLQPVPKLPIWMEELQYIDFVRNDYDTALKSLLNVLTPPNPLQDLLDQQVSTYRQTNDLIGEALLRVLDEGRDSLTITPEAEALIERSKRAVAYRRRLIRGGMGVVALLVIIAILSAITAIGANASADVVRNNLATVQAEAALAVTAAAEAGTRIESANKLFELLYDQSGIVVVGDGPRDLAWYGTGLCVANLRDDTVMQVDLRSGAPLVNDIHVIPVGDAPTALTWDGTYLWVANNKDDTVMRIDPAVHQVLDTIGVDDQPTALAWDGTSLWVSSRGSDTIQQIDPQQLRVIRTINVDDDPQRTSGPAALLWDGTNNRLWVANQGANTVQLVDREGGLIARSFAVGSGPNALAWDGRNLWVSNSLNNTIQRLDPESGPVGEPVPVGNTPAALLWDGTSLWVANSRDKSLMRFAPVDETRTTWQQIMPPVEVGENPRAMVWGDRRLWVANGDDASVMRVDVSPETADYGSPTDSG